MNAGCGPDGHASDGSRRITIGWFSMLYALRPRRLIAHKGIKIHVGLERPTQGNPERGASTAYDWSTGSSRRNDPRQFANYILN
jgi:hypothetical protein